MDSKTYTQVAQSYLAAFRALREVSAKAEVISRGVGEISMETLVERADTIAEFSAQMIPLADEYLRSDDPALREGISMQFLAQASAELEIATELLQITDEKIEHAPAVTRSVRSTELQSAIDDLETIMATPITDGIPIKSARSGGATTVELAKQALSEKTALSAKAISKHVQDLGGDIAFNLVIKSDWGVVLEGAGLIGKGFAAQLEKLREGAGAFLKRAVAVARKTLLNVYDKLLALLGKDLESQARQKIKEWLEKIESDEKIELFDSLVDKMYRVDGLNNELKVCLEETQADLARLNDTTQRVGNIADKFIILISKAQSLERILILAKAIKMPQVLTIIAGLQITLLAVVVYGGYDYIGYRERRFPNLTQGVGEVLQSNIGCSM